MQLFVSQILNSLLSGWAFHSTVPTVIIAATITVFFAIGLIMPIVIGYQILKSKAILISQIMNNPVSDRISSAFLSKSCYLILISFQETPGNILKSHIIFCQVLT